MGDRGTGSLICDATAGGDDSAGAGARSGVGSARLGFTAVSEAALPSRSRGWDVSAQPDLLHFDWHPMAVTFPDELLHSAHLTEQELRLELAVTLFQQDRLTLGQAARYCELSQLELQRVLAARKIPLHYGLEELDADLAWAASRQGK